MTSSLGPEYTEVKKMMALSRSSRKLIRFVDWVKKEAESKSCTVEDLLGEDSLSDTVFSHLGIDVERLRREQNDLVERLQSRS